MTIDSFQTKEEDLRQINEQRLWPYSLTAAVGNSYPMHSHRTDEMLDLIAGWPVFTEEDSWSRGTLSSQRQATFGELNVEMAKWWQKNVG